VEAPGVWEILSKFAVDPPWIVAVLAVGLGYALAVRRANTRPSRPQPIRSQLAFYLGLVLVLVAVLSPIEYWGNRLLWVNFLDFLILTMFAAPLIVFGAPLTVLFRAAGPVGRARLRWLYRRSFFSRFTFPIFTWLLFAALTYLWQFSGLTDLAARNVYVRDLQLATLLVASILFWMPALAVDPARWRLSHPLRFFYVMVEMGHKALFGGMFLALTAPVNDGFAANVPAWGPSPMTDQRLAIAVLWLGGNLFFLVTLAFITRQWMAFERRNSHRVDRRLALQRQAERERLTALEQVFQKGV
jgi:putative copper resistance protein D